MTNKRHEANELERQEEVLGNNRQSLYRKFCKKHCIFEENGECPHCKTGVPGFVRPRNQVNPNNKEEIKYLEKNGLIEPEESYIWETKEQRDERFKTRKKNLKIIDARHKKYRELLKNRDWEGLGKFEEVQMGGLTC